MGWSSGSDVMTKVISSLQEHVPDGQARQEIYSVLIDAFEDQDWDTQSECMEIDPAFDAALKELHPHWHWG